MITVTLITNGKVITGPENTNLLRLSIREKGGIPFKCGGGICGTCRCKIEQGRENTDAVKDKERKHLTDADLAAGHRMACQTFVNGDLSISWIPLADRPRAQPAAGGLAAAEIAAGEVAAGEVAAGEVAAGGVAAGGLAAGGVAAGGVTAGGGTAGEVIPGDVAPGEMASERPVAGGPDQAESPAIS